MSSRTGVVFVNHHSEELIAPRLGDLVDDGAHVVVVDNSGTWEGAAPTLVDLGCNAGFARACNAGVRALPASVDVVVLHNPDVEASPALVRALADAVRSQRSSGIAAPAEQIGQRIRTDGYAYPSVAREAVVAARAVRAGQRGSSPHPSGRQRRPPRRLRRFASGALLAIDRRRFERVAGFDERFFLYGEDLDLWHRIGCDGGQVEFRPALVARHDVSTGSPTGAGRRELLRWLGVELFAESSWPAGTWRALRAVHRPLLRHVAGAERLVEPVAASWRAGATPSEVLAGLRPQLVRRGSARGPRPAGTSTAPSAPPLPLPTMRDR